MHSIYTFISLCIIAFHILDCLSPIAALVLDAFTCLVIIISIAFEGSGGFIPNVTCTDASYCRHQGILFGISLVTMYGPRSLLQYTASNDY